MGLQTRPDSIMSWLNRVRTGLESHSTLLKTPFSSHTKIQKRDGRPIERSEGNNCCQHLPGDVPTTCAEQMSGSERKRHCGKEASQKNPFKYQAQAATDQKVQQAHGQKNKTRGAGFQSLTTEELVLRLQAEQVPCAQVNDLDAMFVDPQVVHNEIVHTWEHPTMGEMRHAKPPVRFSHTQHETVWAVDELGQSTEVVLRAHNYGDVELEALRTSGVIK